MESINSKNLKKVRKNILNKNLLFEKFDLDAFKSNKFDILLIDDDLICTEIFLMSVANLDIFNNIITEQNSPIAIEYLEELKNNNKKLPDIIFVDINMPIMNGYQFLENFNKLFTYEDALIIFFSSYKPEPWDIIKQKNVAYMEKPFDLNDLLEILKEKWLQ